jgi:hypothetical protein
VQLFFSAKFTSVNVLPVDMTISLYRGATPIFSEALATLPGTGEDLTSTDTIITYVFRDDPGAGSFVYTLTATPSVTSVVTAYLRSYVALGVKR